MACTIDFRCLDEGFGGKTLKRKRAQQQQQQEEEEQALEEEEIEQDASSYSSSMDVDPHPPPASKRQAVASSSDPDRPSLTYDGVIAGRVSGRKWKDVRTKRASSVLVSRKGTTAEQRFKDKEIKKAYRERMNELKDEIRKNKQEKRRLREERDKKKQENILRSGTKLQKITNPNTLKKIAKSKQRKLLKVVPDDLLNTNNHNHNHNKKKNK